MIRITIFTLALTLCLAAHGELIQYADMNRVATLPEVRAFEAQLRAAADTNDHSALLALARSADHSDREVTVREHLRVATAMQLARTRLTPELATWLQSQVSSAVLVHVAHEHAGHTTALPAYDPAAAARYALAQQTQRDNAALVRRSLLAGNGVVQSSATLRSKSAPGTDAGVWQLAVKDLDRATLAREINSLSAQLVDQPALGPALIAAAQRLGQPALLTRVVQHGHPRDARAALRSGESLNLPFDRLTLIRAAIARPETAAAGLHALSRATAEDPALTEELLGYLRRDELADAAAAAIASSARSDLIPRLLRELEATDNPTTGSALVLTLSLMPDAAARRALIRWSQDAGNHAVLRAKIRRAYAGGAQ